MKHLKEGLKWKVKLEAYCAEEQDRAESVTLGSCVAKKILLCCFF